MADRIPDLVSRLMNTFSLLPKFNPKWAWVHNSECDCVKLKRDNIAGKASTRANQTFTRRMFHESESLAGEGFQEGLAKRKHG
ncbi:unnamed protein product [Sphenostylis stenocarpa]|uniref:Uncharacterized protein n=1 Tax=Sphenostylis stenocarpa TaxID=92480 RepID=A0AA86VJG0_9FABA|nr:unnamed protein product [Sphenostylis stenocarpa]